MPDTPVPVPRAVILNAIDALETLLPTPRRSLLPTRFERTIRAALTALRAVLPPSEE